MSKKFGKSGAGKSTGMSTKLLHTPSNTMSLGKKGGGKKAM